MGMGYISEWDKRDPSSTGDYSWFSAHHRQKAWRMVGISVKSKAVFQSSSHTNVIYVEKSRYLILLFRKSSAVSLIFLSVFYLIFFTTSNRICCSSLNHVMDQGAALRQHSVRWRFGQSKPSFTRYRKRGSLPHIMEAFLSHTVRSYEA